MSRETRREGRHTVHLGTMAAFRKMSVAHPLAVIVVIVILAAAASPAALSQKTTVVNANDDLPPGPVQAKAAASCLVCHDARIIVQQRLSKAAWTKEVDKMIRWGAVLEANDHDALVDYLSASFSPDRPAYQPLRTSSEKTGAKKAE